MDDLTLSCTALYWQLFAFFTFLFKRQKFAAKGFSEEYSEKEKPGTQKFGSDMCIQPHLNIKRF